MGLDLVHFPAPYITLLSLDIGVMKRYVEITARYFTGVRLNTNNRAGSSDVMHFVVRLTARCHIANTELSLHELRSAILPADSFRDTTNNSR